MKYLIVTNNPLVKEELSSDHEVSFEDQSYLALLKRVRNMIHEGAKLLSHPQAGSIKPGETPYRSVLVEPRSGDVDIESLELIESAIAATTKFHDKWEQYRADFSNDFQYVDLALIKSGIASADQH